MHGDNIYVLKYVFRPYGDDIYVLQPYIALQESLHISKGSFSAVLGHASLKYFHNFTYICVLKSAYVKCT